MNHMKGGPLLSTPFGEELVKWMHSPVLTNVGPVNLSFIERVEGTVVGSSPLQKAANRVQMLL